MSVLLIGGLDPLGRAGILADLEACRAAGVRAQVVCTALTAQDDSKCLSQSIPAPLLAEQLKLVLGQAQPRVVKTGWIDNEEQLKVLLELLPSGLKLVVDPLLATSSGKRVFSGDIHGPLYTSFLRRADLLMPNLIEAAEILGAEIDDVTEAASALKARGIQRLVLKGGHAEGEQITDLFMDADGGLRFLRHERLPGSHRGTGCRLASSLAAHLCAGASYEDATVHAVAWLSELLEH